MEVVPADLTRQAVPIISGRGKEPLPALRPPGIRVFSRKGPRKLHPSGSSADILFVAAAYALEVPEEIRLETAREERHAVSVSLPRPDDDPV